MMFDYEFSDKITISVPRLKQSIELDQNRIHIRENQKGLMAVSYIAPVFESMDLEKFFGDVLTSEMVNMDIGGSGEFMVRFRGLIEGKGKNFPQNFEHKIILLQGAYMDPRINFQATGYSRFKLKDEVSE